MSRPLCSVCCEANWSLGVNILGDIAEWAEFHTTEDVLLKLIMVYCKLDVLIKTEDGLLKIEDNSK